MHPTSNIVLIVTRMINVVPPPPRNLCKAKLKQSLFSVERRNETSIWFVYSKSKKAPDASDRLHLLPYRKWLFIMNIFPVRKDLHLFLVVMQL